MPYTTARGWVRQFRRRVQELGVAFAALAVELGGDTVCRLPTRPGSGWGRSARRATRAA